MTSFPFAQARSAAVITGAASGIGAATAVQLGREGADVALLDRDADGLERVAAEVSGHGVRASVHTVDVADSAQVADAAEAVRGEHGGSHILVYCAGVSLLGTVEQLSLEEFEWLLRINLWGTIVTTKSFLPQLLARPAAHISNLSSGYGLVAPPGRAPYATSKFAVRGFTESLRGELATRSVSVSVVHPGGITTQIAMNARAAAGIDPETARRAAVAQTAVYRTTPEDAARVIVDGIRRRRPRVLIGTDARVLDLLARAAPAHAWAVLRRRLGEATRT